MHYYKEDFFSSIETERQAYWLGFIAADGCIASGRNTVQVKLKNGDIVHLRKLQLDLDTSSPVTRYEKYCQFRANCKCLYDSLVKHGLTPRKSESISWDVIVRNVSPALHKHVLRGYFDGDGCWGTKGRNQRYASSIVFTITTISIDMAEGIQRFLNDNGISVSIYGDRHYRVQTANRSKYACIYSLLYGDADIYLERKRNSALQFLGEQHEIIVSTWSSAN